MLEERTIKTWKLSDENKQTIKDNAQKIKNYFVTLDYYTCIDFFDDYCRSYSEFLNLIEKYLPFVKKERAYIFEDEIIDLVTEIDKIIEEVESCLTIEDFSDVSDVRDFLIREYDIYNLVQKILEYNNEEFINKLLND